MTSTTAGFTLSAGAEPAERTVTAPWAWWCRRAPAIWERPALCTQTNRTSGVVDTVSPSGDYCSCDLDHYKVSFMSVTEITVFVLVAVLAAVNGSNDVPKGVATLAGAGVTSYRPAILWGTAPALVGCVCSLAVASKMTDLFSKGIISGETNEA